MLITLIIVLMMKTIIKKKSDHKDSKKSYSSSGIDNNEESELEQQKDKSPANYFFPSFVACVLWGQFSNESGKFPLFSLDDADKTAVMSREEGKF